MPSLNLFRQASAEADVRSEMSNIGIALLVLGLMSPPDCGSSRDHAGAFGRCRSSSARTSPTR